MVPSAGRHPVRRALVVAAAVVALLSGCTATPVATPAGSEAASTGSSAVPSVSAAAQPPGEEAVPVVVDAAALPGMGLDEGLAPFLAATTVAVASPDAHTYVIRSRFPNGATAQTVTRLFAGGDLQPGDPPVVTAVRGPEEFAFRVVYAIAAADLPADMRERVLADLPPEPPSPAGVGGRAPGSVARARAVAADGPSVIGAVTDGVISQGAETVIEGWAEKVGGAKGSNAVKALSNGKKVWEALDLNAAVAAAQARVAAARACAQNPTNPLTRKAWEDDPAARQQALDRLDEIADEITANAAVIVSQMVADVAGGGGPAWLGFVTGPAVNYVKDTMTSIMDNLVREAEALVPKCTAKAYRASGGGPRVTVGGTVRDLTKPFSLNGSGDGFVVTFSYTPTDVNGRMGTVEYEGHGNGFTMSGSGEYTISGRDGGRLTLKQRHHGCVDIGDCATNTDVITLTPITVGG